MLLSLSFAAIHCVASGTAAATPSEFTVTAKLIEIPTKFPPNEVYDYAFVMKYEVQGGERDKQTLLVAHFNPRIHRKKVKGKMAPFAKGNVRGFKVGALHRLKLHSDIEKIWTGALVDEYSVGETKSHKRYWCMQADMAK